ncbi:MAG: hypothetical protein ABSG43_06420 [Solirubrobacteraceae bacterium]|jgi:predicted lipoprotein with Yx(FWY)xxD motif
MVIDKQRKRRAGGAAAAVCVALLAAACGSTSNSSSTASSAPAAASTTVSTSSASAAGVAVGSAKGPDGTYLTGAGGRALYLWVADSDGASSCSGACAKAWPPLTTTATPVASGGVQASDLATITRSDGTKQVTYKGHPLYYFIADPSAGTTKGQGSDSFGAKWWLVAPSGVAITTGGSSRASGSGGSTSTSSSGGWA